MEFYLEFILTAVFSVLIFYLIGKIAVVGVGNKECAEDATVSCDHHASAAAEEKSEGPGLEEADAPGVQAGKKEELLGSERGVFSEVKEELGVQGNIAGTDEVSVEEEVTANIPEVVEVLGDGDDLIVKEEEGEIERPLVEGNEIVVERDSKGGVEEEGSLLLGEDDWEGIEKSELEELFSVATEYVLSSSGSVALGGLSSDVQMDFYGLYKIATEGSCYESQPLPLNFSARSKWLAWQKLGNMTPEVAMERYIALLSKYIPGWAEAKSGKDAKCARGNDSIAGLSDPSNPDLKLSLQSQLFSETQRKSEDHSLDEIVHASDGSKTLEQGFAGAFILNLLSPTRGAFLSIYW